MNIKNQICKGINCIQPEIINKQILHIEPSFDIRRFKKRKKFFYIGDNHLNQI